jgi:hypothetical protein
VCRRGLYVQFLVVVKVILHFHEVVEELVEWFAFFVVSKEVSKSLLGKLS